MGVMNYGTSSASSAAEMHPPFSHAAPVLVSVSFSAVMSHINWPTWTCYDVNRSFHSSCVFICTVSCSLILDVSLLDTSNFLTAILQWKFLGSDCGSVEACQLIGWRT